MTRPFIKLLLLFGFLNLHNLDAADFPNGRIDSLIYHGKINEAINVADFEIKQLRDTNKKESNFSIYQLYMCKAECYYQCAHMENFKNFTDSALCYLNRACPDTTIYHAMIYTNYARYYHYLIIPDVADNWGKLAKRIYRKKKNEAGKIDAFLIYQSVGSYYRNMPNVNAIAEFDTAFVLYRKSHKLPDYMGAILYRSYGNACLDRVVTYPANLTSPYLQKGREAFLSGLAIMKKYYPDNLCGQTYFLNLLGLLNYYIHDYTTSNNYFNKGHELLEEARKENNNDLNYPDIFLTNRNWHIYTLEGISTPANRLQIARQELKNEEEAEKVFNDFAIKEIHDNTKSFRDIYSISPYQMLVPLCYEIYSVTGETEMKYKALEYSEKRKMWNYYNTILAKDSSDKFQKAITPPIDGKQIINKIQSALCDSCAVIEYCENESPAKYGLLAFIITRKQFRFIRLTEPNERDFKLIVPAFLNDKNNFEDYFYTYYKLYRLLFSKIENMLPENVNNITLIPTNDMCRVCFDAMIRDTVEKDFKKMDYLFKHYNFHYQLSLSLMPQYAPFSNIIKSVFVCPQYADKNLITLPDMDKCTMDWQSEINGELITGTNLNKNTVLSSFKDKDLIQLTGHTLAHVLDIDAYKFYLRDNADSSCSYLTEGDIINNHINANLVVYTSCMGGMGDFDRNEGLISFARAFTFAGAKSVLYSLCKADDKSTAFITNCFYENLVAGQTKDMALYNAKKKYLAQCKTSDEANPVYWAGLSIVGDTNPLHLTISHNYLLGVLMGAIGLIIIGFLLILYRVRKD